MAELGGAAVGAAASVGVAAYTTLAGFSARHDQSHDAQALETRWVIDRFEKLRAQGDLAEENYDSFLEKKEAALQAGRDYGESISKYKAIPALNIPRKLKTRAKVRRQKMKVRKANQDLQDHYYDSSSSCTSDASSIAAESGSPPESHSIREWIDDVHECEVLPQVAAEADSSDSDENSFGDWLYLQCSVSADEHDVDALPFVQEHIHWTMPTRLRSGISRDTASLLSADLL